jgi:hypothetical protein
VLSVSGGKPWNPQQISDSAVAVALSVVVPIAYTPKLGLLRSILAKKTVFGQICTKFEQND